MTASHVVYGLRLSATQTLPGLPSQHDSELFDLRIELKEGGPVSSALASFARSSDSCSGSLITKYNNLMISSLLGGQYLAFFYADGARFAIERQGREVWVDWPENYTIEDACTYLIGPVMGLVLRLRGTVCLHASAVAIGDRAFALVGSPGAGKSTTAAAFARSGFPVLSDDVVALADKGDHFLVPPGYPRVNLWPDSVRALFGSEKRLPRITPTWDKRYLPLGQNGHHFASNPLPLGAIYILDNRDANLTAPVVEGLSAKEALITLVANTYVNYLLDQNMRRKEFDVLSRVVSSIPVRRVRPPDRPSAILELCGAIADDARRVTAAVPANAAAALG